MKRERWIVFGVFAGTWLVPPIARAGAAEPLFVEQVGALAPEACDGTGCWTNYLRVADLDGDDALDIVLVNYGGFFSQGTPEPLVIYRNDGTGVFVNRSAEAVNDFSGRIRQVAIGDVNGDGFVDLYAAEGGGGTDVLFLNDGTGVFEPVEHALGSNAGAVRFGDLDDDGDLDLFLADGYATADTVHGHVYLNDGAGEFTELTNAVPPPGTGRDPDDVELLDIDGDFDLDIFLNAHEGDSALWLNRGDGTFVDASDRNPGQPRGYHYDPGACDVDGDGDLDLWIDNTGPNCAGTCDEQLLINDGQGNLTDETLARVQGNPIVDDNGVACVDFDYDGDFDAVVYSLGTGERYLENDGTGHFTRVGGVFPDEADSTLWGEFGDLDGDGRLDLVTGQGEGTTADRVYFGTASQAIDETPPAFRAVETFAVVEADREVVLHFAVTDNAVTDGGPRLSRAYVLFSAGGGDQGSIEASFMGGDLFRAVLPALPEGTPGTAQPCAVDRRGNEGCADAFTYDVVVGGGDETTGTESDTGSEGSAGSESAGSADAGGNETSTTGAIEGSSDGTDESGTESGGGSVNDDSGCGCRTPGPATRSASLFGLTPGSGLLWGLTVLMVLRRRRTGVHASDATSASS